MLSPLQMANFTIDGEKAEVFSEVYTIPHSDVVADSRPMSKKYIMEMIFKYGVLEANNNTRIQCIDCKRGFESESFRSSHTCITAAAIGSYRTY